MFMHARGRWLLWLCVTLQLPGVTEAANITLACARNDTVCSALTDLYTSTSLQTLNLTGWTAAANGTNTSYCTFQGVNCTSNNASVLSLSLRAQGLNGSLPSSLGNLTNLTKLDVSVNNLSGLLPASLSALTSLTQLLLNNNSFTGAVPPAWSSLSQLVVLNLASNSLSGALPANLSSALIAANANTVALAGSGLCGNVTAQTDGTLPVCPSPPPMPPPALPPPPMPPPPRPPPSPPGNATSNNSSTAKSPPPPSPPSINSNGTNQTASGNSSSSGNSSAPPGPPPAPVAPMFHVASTLTLGGYSSATFGMAEEAIFDTVMTSLINVSASTVMVDSVMDSAAASGGNVTGNATASAGNSTSGSNSTSSGNNTSMSTSNSTKTNSTSPPPSSSSSNSTKTNSTSPPPSGNTTTVSGRRLLQMPPSPPPPPPTPPSPPSPPASSASNVTSPPPLPPPASNSTTNSTRPPPPSPPASSNSTNSTIRPPPPSPPPAGNSTVPNASVSVDVAFQVNTTSMDDANAVVANLNALYMNTTQLAAALMAGGLTELTSVTVSVQPTVVPDSTMPSSSSSPAPAPSNAMSIAGIVIGVIGCLSGFSVAVYFYLKAKRSAQEAAEAIERAKPRRRLQPDTGPRINNYMPPPSRQAPLRAGPQAAAAAGVGVSTARPIDSMPSSALNARTGAIVPYAGGVVANSNAFGLPARVQMPYGSAPPARSPSWMDPRAQNSMMRGTGMLQVAGLLPPSNVYDGGMPTRVPGPVRNHSMLSSNAFLGTGPGVSRANTGPLSMLPGMYGSMAQPGYGGSEPPYPPDMGNAYGGSRGGYGPQVPPAMPFGPGGMDGNLRRRAPMGTGAPNGQPYGPLDTAPGVPDPYGPIQPPQGGPQGGAQGGPPGGMYPQGQAAGYGTLAYPDGGSNYGQGPGNTPSRWASQAGRTFY